jgi:CheY-like chemotaxis protein
MMPKPRVLWVEDSARLELSNLSGPVLSSGRYDFHLAEDVTTAVNFLRAGTFDAVLVDVRLPPGVDAHWQKWYRAAGANKVGAQLGLKLLHWLIERDLKIYPLTPPNGLLPQQIGIFTVESPQEIREELQALKIEVYQQKVAGLPDRILIDLFDRLLAYKVKDRQ